MESPRRVGACDLSWESPGIPLMSDGAFLAQLGKFPNDFMPQTGLLISGSTVRARVRPPSKNQRLTYRFEAADEK